MKRTLCILLSLMLAVTGFAGLAIPASAAESGKAIELMTNGAADYILGAQVSSVWFGNYKQSSDGNGGYNVDPVKWRVLENKDGRLFLLADQNLDVVQYHESKADVTWETCMLRAWLNGYDGHPYDDTFITSAFTGKELSAVADSSEYGTSGGNGTTDKVFLLSIEDAMNTNYGFPYDKGKINSLQNETVVRESTNTAYVAAGGHTGTNKMSGIGKAGFWWLRSPGYTSRYAVFVTHLGIVYEEGIYVDSLTNAVRPAFYLDLNSVLFTSAAEGGKKSAEDGTLSPVGDYAGSEWKLTVLDADRSDFTASCIRNQDGVYTIAYSGAKTGDNEYISAVIVNSSGTVTDYGRLCQAESGSDKVVTVDISGKMNKGDKLYVFNEQVNGDKKTDYASMLRDVTGIGSQRSLIVDRTFLKEGVNTANAKTIWYGGSPWRMIGFDGQGTASENGAMTLLASGGMGECAFNQNGTNNQYSNSNCTLQKRVGEIFYAFSTPENIAVQRRTLAAGTFDGNNTDCIAGSSTFTALWALSTREANVLDSDLRAYGSASGWWLRSPGNPKNTNFAATVQKNGNVNADGEHIRSTLDVRPAFYVDLNRILFASAAVGGKQGDGALTRIDGYHGNEWKLTVWEENHRGFTVNETDVTARPGSTLTLHYQYAETGENEYISAIVTDLDGNALYYGRIMQPTDENGTLEITIPADLEKGAFSLYVFNEQVNGDKMTDYASNLIEVVKADAVKAADLQTGDTFEMGMYPQTQVTDDATITALNAIDCTMTDYGYMQNSKADNHTFDALDMTYADIAYNGQAYRKVTINEYRPYFTVLPSSSSNTYQADNGYVTGNTYYFKWEPIVWQVLARESDGVYVMSQSLLDSQSYHNYLEFSTWETSSLRTWLNEGFYNGAFSEGERSKLISCTLSNVCDNPFSINDGGNDTTDKLWVLSFSDSIDSAYGFQGRYYSDPAKEAAGTDYAKSQGLSADPSNGCSIWWLRSPGEGVPYGSGINENGYGPCNPSRDSTEIGVRPAFKLSLDAAVGTADSDICRIAEHSYGDWTSADADHHKRVCSVCGAEETASHSWEFLEWDWRIEPNVIYTDMNRPDIYYTVKCSGCGEEKSIQYDNRIPTFTAFAPTCTEDGRTQYEAPLTYNGESHDYTYIFTADVLGDHYKATGHDWGDWNSISDTQHQRICKNDGTHKETESHTYGDVSYTWEQTAGAWKATAKHTCTVCGWEESETVIGTGVKSKEPTCTEKGETTYTAAFENAAFETQQKTVADIGALNHDWKTEWSKDGVHHWNDCTRCDAKNDEAAHTYGDISYTWEQAEGAWKATAKRTCTVCEWDETETVTATGAQSKAPTCTVNGETTYTAQFENAAFETQQKTVADIDALNHDWQTAWSKDGVNHWHDCTRCDEKNDEAAHDYGDVSYTWEQTRGAWKVTAKRTCTVCEWEETETVTATGAQSKAPTCTVNGETTYTATFTNTAFETQQKTVADIPALNHDWQSEWSKDGVNHWHDCTRCDEKNDEAAHTYGDVTYTWEQTGGAWKATAKRTCTVCEWEETETVTATGAQSKDPTCTVNGETTYTAAFENAAFETQTKTVDDIAALDHAYDAVVTEPTCTEDGYTTHTCSRCGDTYTDSETAALGHAWGEWEIVRTATPNEKGEKKRVCTRCGEVETAEIDELILTSSVDGQTGSSLVVTVPYAKRGMIATTLTADEPVTYTSSNPQLLRVDKDGNVTFARMCIFCKTATVTAVSADGSKVATCKVNIEIKWWQYIIWFFLGSLWF